MTYQEFENPCGKCGESAVTLELSVEGPWRVKSESVACSACGARHRVRITVLPSGKHRVSTRLDETRSPPPPKSGSAIGVVRTRSGKHTVVKKR